MKHCIVLSSSQLQAVIRAVEARRLSLLHDANYEGKSIEEYAPIICTAYDKLLASKEVEDGTINGQEARTQGW